MKINKKAFTLVELLVVILIIGILAAIAVPQYQLAIEKSRASEAFILLKAIKQAEDIYFLSNPEDSVPTLEKLDIDIPGEIVENKPSVRRTNYFDIGFHWDNNISPHAIKTDKNGNILYYLAYYYPVETPSFYCVLPRKTLPNYHPQYTAVCKGLGGVQSNVCYSSEEANNDTCFKLP